jgi:hypothetical protein
MTGTEIFIGFVISYIAGNIPSLKQQLSRGDNLSLQEKINQCYQKALEKWCVNDALKQRMAQQRYATPEKMAETVAKDNVEDAVAVKSLASLWAEELRKDEECAHFIQEQTINAVSVKIDNLTELVKAKTDNGEEHHIRRGLTQHKPVKKYIRRYCATENSADSFVYYALELRQRHCLADYVTGLVENERNKYILYSSAQTGKTTELKQLCWELQETRLYLPVSFEVRNNTQLKRGDLPDYRFNDGKEVVVVIDALDEVNGQKYEDLIEEISGYAYDHPEMKVVLSCRSNYRREKRLEQFCDLFLEELSYGDATAHIENELGQGSGLISYINESQLGDFAKNPFFLNVLIDAYRDIDKTPLPKTKADIYRLFIEKSYHEEKNEKTVPVAKRHSFDEAVVLLERVALGLSLMNVQTLSEEEMLICLDNSIENKEECLRYDLIRFEDCRYSFQHNAFREWLVANYLKREGVERAKYLATQKSGRIKPEWYNIIMLWVSMYGEAEKEEVTAILGWLRSACLDLIVYIDKEMLTEETRSDVFKGLLLEYKSLGIRMANILSQDYKDLLRFGQSVDTVQFIIDELQGAVIGTAYYSDLMCLCYFLNWNKLSYESKDLTEELVQTLEKKTIEVLTQEPKHDLSFLFMENPFFTQQQYLERLFAIIKDSNYYEAIKSMARLISEADVVDDYVDYILDKEKYVHNQHEGSTTHIVSRTAIYEALSKVRKAESVKSILNHSFINFHSCYRDEWEKYGLMMKNCLTLLSGYVKKGQKEFIGEIENYYVRTFKDYHYHFDHDRHAQEIITELRECYLEAGLREKGKIEFEEQVHSIFDEHVEHTHGDVEQTFKRAALWITTDDVKDYFFHFDVNNPNDRAKASWFGEIPYKEVAVFANGLYKEIFPELPVVGKRRERQRASFNDFADYGTFRQVVLEMVGDVEKFETRREHWDYLREIEDGYNQYAYRFMMYYTYNNGKYYVDGIIKGIKNKVVYDGFFMKEISELRSRPNDDLTITEEHWVRCIETAKETVAKLVNREKDVYFKREALELLLKGEFDVTPDLLIGLLDYAEFTISKQDPDGFYSREYSILDYVSERVDVNSLAPVAVRKLKETIGQEKKTPYLFANYIVEKHVEDGYDYVLKFALSKNPLSFNILELLIKSSILVEEIKAATRNMVVSDRLNVYSSLIRNVGEKEWVKQELEPVYKSFSGYDLRMAVRLLVGNGSLDALDYLVKQPDLMKDGEDFYFNYDQTNAIPSLCYFIQYAQEQKLEGFQTLNTILNSLEIIALRDAESLTEVKQYLKELTKKGEPYKYLNRYVIAFEDKYYSSNPGISDIKAVMALVKEDVNALAAKEERENKADAEDVVYISYSWKDASKYTVDYLCFVLDTNHIPFKRDQKDCPYTSNIREFMNAIRAGRMIVVVLSRTYLFSTNCMYELTGIIEAGEYKNRILPVVMDDTIRESLFYVDLVKYWKGKKEEQEEVVNQLDAIDPAMAEPEAEKLREIEAIYSKLREIKKYIDWTNAENLESLSASHFRSIIEIIKNRKG